MNLYMKPSRRKKIDMYNSEEGNEIRTRLQALEKDEHYATTPGPTTDLATYPDGRMPFVETHLLYLSRHNYVNPDHYLSNLRLKIRIR